MISSKIYGSALHINKISELPTTNEQELLDLKKNYLQSSKQNQDLKTFNTKLLHKLNELLRKQELEKVKVENLETKLKLYDSKQRSQQAPLNVSVSSKNSDEPPCKNLSVDSEQIQRQYLELAVRYKRLRELYLYEFRQRKHLSTMFKKNEGNIRVVCRCRPSIEHGPCYFSFESSNTIIIPAPIFKKTSLPIKDDLNGRVVLDRVYEPTTSQIDMFGEIKPLLRACIEGQNVSIITYGALRSGKTYTMQGDRANPGITVRSIYELLKIKQQLSGVWIVKTSVSMFEVYNEMIYDLLSKNYQPVRLTNKGKDVETVGAKVKELKSKHEFLYWIGKGHARRRLAANQRGSGPALRSHLIIQIHMELTNTIDSVVKHSTLIFCDLAGNDDMIIRSADSSITNADNMKQTENCFIKKSLSTLECVLKKFLEHSPDGVVPYSDSKLTHLLQPCLNEKSLILLMLTISGGEKEYFKNVPTLKFAHTIMPFNYGEKF